MTERERREGPGETKDNVRDDLDEASRDRKKDDGAPDAAKAEEAAGGGGIKDNAKDELDETQRH